MILAGGGGTRLWPVSHTGCPKQFLPLPLHRTLIEQAVSRARKLAHKDRVWIVTTASQVAQTRKVLRGFNPKRILAEPEGKNSGPAAAFATFWIEAMARKPVTILIFPADHYIPIRKSFVSAMRTGIAAASRGSSLITFGLKPQSARTDFGYIEVSRDSASRGVRSVKRFVEKPPLSRAKRFIRSGRHYWNSGIFAWRSDLLREELSRRCKNIYLPLRMFHFGATLSRNELIKAYRKLPNISIDYALIERSRRIETIPSAFEWSDLGTWAAVYEAALKNGHANVVSGPGRVVDGTGNYVRAEEKPVVVFGVDNLVVIDTPRITMVVPREKSPDLKRYRERLERMRSS